MWSPLPLPPWVLNMGWRGSVWQPYCPHQGTRTGCETTNSMNCGPRMGASGKFALSAAPFGVAPNLVVILEINNFEHNFCSRSLNVKWLHLHLTQNMKKTLTNANQVTLANWTCWVIANPSRFLCAILKTAQLLSWLNHFFVRTSFLCINRFTRNDSWGNTLCWLNFYPWRLHFPFLCIFD